MKSIDQFQQFRDGLLSLLSLLLKTIMLPSTQNMTKKRPRHLNNEHHQFMKEREKNERREGNVQTGSKQIKRGFMQIHGCLLMGSTSLFLACIKMKCAVHSHSLENCGCSILINLFSSFQQHFILISKRWRGRNACEKFSN